MNGVFCVAFTITHSMFETMINMVMHKYFFSIGNRTFNRLHLLGNV